MSKTPEELAAEYADSQWPRKKGFTYGGLNRWLNEAFLAGYQAAAPQWISVKDRLPEKGDRVLISYHDGVSIGSYHRNDDWHVIGIILRSVTHWMPLPKPPEE
jgi:hypothetical protein